MKRNWVYMEEAKDGEQGAAAGATTDASTQEVKTVLTGETASTGTAKTAETAPLKAVEPTWPTNWQELVSKGDEKRAAHVKRYASPEAMADALISAQNRIRSGELKAQLPENPKPEELAQWRKDNGIPEAPDKYDLKFDSGLVIGKEDKPGIDAFLKSAHDMNMQPNQVKAAVEWYYQEQERRAEEQASKDEQHRTEALDSLNIEWGKNFRTEMNLITGSVLSMFPEEVRDDLIGARLPDGRGVFNDPRVLKAFAALAHIVNPAGVVVPSGGGDPAQSALSEYAELQKQIGTQSYTKDENKQARHRELITYLHGQGLIDGNGNVVQKRAA